MANKLTNRLLALPEVQEIMKKHNISSTDVVGGHDEGDEYMGYPSIIYLAAKNRETAKKAAIDINKTVTEKEWNEYGYDSYWEDADGSNFTDFCIWHEEL